MAATTVEQAFAIATEHYNVGRLREAESWFERILATLPDQPDALQMLGIVMHHLGRGTAGIELLRRAIDLNPENPNFHSNLGIMLAGVAQLEQGAAEVQKALTLRPDFAEAHNNLGNILKAMGRRDEAMACYRQAIANKSDYAEAHNNLGALLQDRGEPEQALVEIQSAVRLRDNNPEAHNNLGNVLQDLGRIDEAIPAYRRALSLQANYPDAHHNLASALRAKNQLDEAMSEFRIALSLRPQYAEAMWGVAFLMLLQGDYPNGWRTFESRLKMGHKPFFLQIDQGAWEGAVLNGQSILLHAEQGLGDTIQFARYIPMVKARGAGTIVLCCNSQLRRLLSGQLGIDQIVSEGEGVPPADLRCPLMTLPRIFGTTVENIPADVPYLRADPARAEAWRVRLESEIHRRQNTAHQETEDQESKTAPNAICHPASPVKIGLVWAGNRRHINDRNRSLPLSAFAPLAQLPNVRLISLQKGQAAAEVQTGGIDIIDRTSEIRDMADTAALVANLDLVISVDTSVAHLAGAMGKPTWALIPFAPDWRWMLNRSDSPWYPTIRLFRQPALGDWGTPLRRIVEEVAHGKLSRQDAC